MNEPPATACITEGVNLRIRYGARSAISRWFDSYWTERDRRAAPWLIVAVLLGFLLFGPRLLLALLSILPMDQLGNSGASMKAHQTLLCLASVLAGTAGTLLVRALLKPSFLELSPIGIRKIWSFPFVKVKGENIRWTNVTHIYIYKPPQKTDTRSFELCIHTKQAKKLRLPLKDLEDNSEREALLNSISKHAIDATVQPAVIDALLPSRSLSFTEIWLEALSAPPGRERLLPLSPGILLNGRYRIAERLGGGGQGTVYLAQDTESGQQVVLKETILPVYADLLIRKRAIEKFHQEAMALETVEHPSIVKYNSSFVADHRAYLVLQYIPGKTLSTFVQENGPMATSQTIEFGLQMCDILHVLHSSHPPLIHRDFTPDNLIVETKTNKLMLIDFAVAVSSDAEACETAGKSSYMAPEQFQGRPSTSSDLYALGATLFYLLTSQHPEPISECYPLSVNRNVDRYLNEIVARCTKYNTNQRFASAQAVKEALTLLTEKA